MLSLLTSLFVRCKDRGNTDGQDYNEGLKVVMSANLWYLSNHCIPNTRKHTLLVKWFSGGGAENNGAVLKSLYQITYVSTHTLSNALLALVFSVSTIQPLLSRESAVEKSEILWAIYVTSEAMLNLRIKGRLRHKENQCKYFNSSKGPLVGRKIVTLKQNFHSTIKHITENNLIDIYNKEKIIKCKMCFPLRFGSP